MNNLSLDRINHFVLHKQHLTEDSQVNDIVQVARDISGLHATGAKEPYLALFARTHNFNKELLDEELYVKKNLGKLRCMRGTLYILAKETIPIAFAATRALVEKLSKQYAEFRGITMSDYIGVSETIMDTLKGRAMGPAEIKAQLGIKLHLPAILNLMCDQGLLMRVQSGDNWKARNYKYALFSEYFPDVDLLRFSEAEAITLLVEQYLASFGPATENDIVWWLGLNKTKVRVALDNMGNKVVKLSVEGLPGVFLSLGSGLEMMKSLGFEGKPVVNLLPQLDPYIMGYKQRERYLGQEHYDRVFDRSGNATSTILIGGRIVGVWDFSKNAEPHVKIYLFEEAKDEVMQCLYSKSQEMGRFIAGKEVSIKEVFSMVPLRQRSAGTFMSPLKT